jgi:hypothetical protein
MTIRPAQKPQRGDGAAAWVTKWQRAQDLLEAQRLRELRSLSERESAQRFARLLRINIPYPLRGSSGLVEQQCIFARLRKPA